MPLPNTQYQNLRVGAPRNLPFVQGLANWQAAVRNAQAFGPMNRVAIGRPAGQSRGRMPVYGNPGQMTGSPMGGAANPLNALLASGMQQQAAANAANQQRFEEIMKGYLKRHDEGMKLADVRANQAYRQMAGDAAQSMVNRGLSNSTEAARKMFDAFEASRQIPLDQFNRTSADPLMFAERKNEVGPDFGQLMQLAQMAGQSQSGIAGQSSPLSQGINIGSYPASAGLAMSRRSPSSFGPSPAPMLRMRPVYAGTMDPFGLTGYRSGSFVQPNPSSRGSAPRAQRQAAPAAGTPASVALSQLISALPGLARDLPKQLSDLSKMFGKKPASNNLWQQLKQGWGIESPASNDLWQRLKKGWGME